MEVRFCKNFAIGSTHSFIYNLAVYLYFLLQSFFMFLLGEIEDTVIFIHCYLVTGGHSI